jgi:sirohydrochlorin cobaltochelatase
MHSQPDSLSLANIDCSHNHGCHGHDHDHHDHHHGPKAAACPKRPGILLAAFGTAIIQARQAYDRFETRVRAQYPHIPVGWAFTAHKVRRKLAGQGLDHDSVAVALSRMHDRGVTHLAVQSLHTIPGVEYFWTMNLAKAYEHPRKGYHRVSLGAPMLSNDEDLLRAASCLPQFIPAQRSPDEAVVLVGHGTYHEGQQYYLDFQEHLRKQNPLLLIGLLMGEPGIDSVIARLQQSSISTVWLLPFMAVCGHHVHKDMYGGHPQSWSNRLRAAGFEVLEHTAGTIESPCFQSIWLDHLDTAMGFLQLN